MNLIKSCGIEFDPNYFSFCLPIFVVYFGVVVKCFSLILLKKNIQSLLRPVITGHFHWSLNCPVCHDHWCLSLKKLFPWHFFAKYLDMDTLDKERRKNTPPKRVLTFQTYLRPPKLSYLHHQFLPRIKVVSNSEGHGNAVIPQARQRRHRHGVLVYIYI